MGKKAVTRGWPKKAIVFSGSLTFDHYELQYQKNGTAKHIENEGADGKLKLVTDLTILILGHIAGVDININFSSYRRSRVWTPRKRQKETAH